MNKLAVVILSVGLMACSKKKPEEGREPAQAVAPGAIGSAAAPAPAAATPAPAAATSAPAAGSAEAGSAATGSAATGSAATP